MQLTKSDEAAGDVNQKSEILCNQNGIQHTTHRELPENETGDVTANRYEKVKVRVRRQVVRVCCRSCINVDVKRYAHMISRA